MKTLSFKVLSLRLLFVIFILSITSFFALGKYDYGIFCIVLLLFAFVPSMTIMQEFADHIVLRQYFFLATIVKVHAIGRKSRPNIISFVTETELDSDIYFQSESNWNFLPMVFTLKTYSKKYKFVYTDNGIEKNVTIRLTENEYKRIQNILTR